jgi:peroxiredoxin
MDLVFAMVAGVSLVLVLFGATTVALLRQNGRMLSRMEALEARAFLPLPLKRGDAVPSYLLADLNGGLVNIADLRGRDRVLVFWDPDDSTCQFMATDLKTQARVTLTDKPEIVIVASGSSDAVRAAGFESPVLLDPFRAVHSLFGVRDSPAAVLIDEHGRVTYDIQTGYLAVFQLTGLAPYVPTEPETVEAMLRLADVTEDDVVYDIGCGDGRIVVMAAKMFGAKAVGVDVNPQRLAEGRENARNASVDHLVRFEQRQFQDVDLRDATVVTLYLLPDMVNAIEPKLRAELRAGTRVVAHDYGFVGWTPDGQVTVGSDELYLYRRT